MNEYTAIVDYYDLLITSGYYQHDKVASAIASVILDNHKIIEVGVGSGLLLEQLLKINPNYNCTGIDHTPEMIAIAKNRLGNKVKLLIQDAISMSIREKFDVAISHGGLGAFINTNNTYHFCSHLIDDQNNLEALKNIYNCLNENGFAFTSSRLKLSVGFLTTGVVSSFLRSVGRVPMTIAEALSLMAMSLANSLRSSLYMSSEIFALGLFTISNPFEVK